MWPFQQTVETEPEAPAVDPAVERLEQIRIELPFLTAARDQIRTELENLRRHTKDPRITLFPSGLFVSINAMHMACPHASLEAAQRRADAKVEDMLRERANLLMQTGRIR
jgi:hypothetical protein